MNNVISTRVSIFRNVKDFKFSNKLTSEQKESILSIIREATKSKMIFAGIDKIDENNKKKLNNLGLILNGTQGLFVDKKENKTINMFNGEHLTLISAFEGFDVSDVEKACAFAQTLANKINFAYTDDYGYLMSDIAKVGVGLKIETNIMLTAIKSINKIEQVKQNVQKLGYSLSETKFPGVYTLSTTCNLGIGEKQIIQDFEKTISKLQELETESAKMLDVSKHDEILDKTQRSVAVLGAAHMINYDELFNIIVNLRLGLNVGVVDLSLQTINDLQNLVIQNSNNQVLLEDMKELAVKVKEILKGGQNV